MVENKTIQIIETKEGELVVSSRQVAEDFNKRHDHVIKAIENKLTNPILGALKYFIESSYIDKKGETRKEYLLTKDGFSFLVMGFTGEKADEWKIKYINAFNEMQRTIKEMKITINKLQEVTYDAIMEIEDSYRRAKMLMEFTNKFEKQEKQKSKEKANTVESDTQLQAILDNIESYYLLTTPSGIRVYDKKVILADIMATGLTKKMTLKILRDNGFIDKQIAIKENGKSTNKRMFVKAV